MTYVETYKHRKICHYSSRSCSAKHNRFQVEEVTFSNKSHSLVLVFSFFWLGETIAIKSTDCRYCSSKLTQSS